MALLFPIKAALTGGAANAVDGIDGAVLSDGDIVPASVSDVLYWYRVNATSGAAESSPDIISPVANAGDKRNILQGLRAASLVLTGNITMGDDKWIGLGASAGRIVFDDQAPDIVRVANAVLDILNNSNGSTGSTLRLHNQFLSDGSNVEIHLIAGDQDSNPTSKIVGVSKSTGVGGIIGELAFYFKANGATGVGLAEGGRLDQYGNWLIGTTDGDNTPATGRLVVKGGTNDGTTNILVGRNSDEANVFWVDTDGNTHTGHSSVSSYLHVGNNYAPTDAGTLSPGIYVHKNGTSAYGIKLQYTGGQWGTFIFGPNHADRFIGFGKIGSALEDDDIVEYARLGLGNGYFGINNSDPSYKLDVLQADNTSGVPIIAARANNATAGMAFTYSGISAIGTNSNINIGFFPKGTGYSYFETGDVHVDQGNILVVGSGGYNAAGETGIVYLGDANSGIAAKYDTGVILGVYKAFGGGTLGTNSMDALTIAQTTGLATFGGNIVVPASGNIGPSGDGDLMVLAADSLTVNGTITATTAKLTNLTAGCLPYHESDAAGLANSPISTNGSVVTFNGIPNDGDVFFDSSTNMTTAGDKLNLTFRQASVSAEVAQIQILCENTDPDVGVVIYTYNGAPMAESFRVSGSGIVKNAATYSHDMNGETIRAVQVNNSGEFGYDSSTERAKINPVDLADSSWIFALRPVEYEPRKKERRIIGYRSRMEKERSRFVLNGAVCDIETESERRFPIRKTAYLEEGAGFTRTGLIAEEVVKVNPDFVFWDTYVTASVNGQEIEVPEFRNRDMTDPENQDRLMTAQREIGFDPLSVQYRSEIAGVHYDRLIVPLLHQVQQLRSELDAVKARLN
jgi:hypothetical protein